MKTISNCTTNYLTVSGGGGFDIMIPPNTIVKLALPSAENLLYYVEGDSGEWEYTENHVTVYRTSGSLVTYNANVRDFREDCGLFLAGALLAAIAFRAIKQYT